MATEIVMPRMGETVDEGTVNEWFKQVGDPVAEGEPLLEIGTVAEGEPLLEIGTDKVDTEIPAPVSGVLSEIRVQQGETVPVATIIAVIS
jgi:pyruvate dehydrogenase E2 component (dihydrolipoamide acetyltransferase)